MGAAPHGWLFKQVSGVVHHGGAGTVAAGLLAGQPTCVCPFFGDQFFWGKALECAGVGLDLGPVAKLTAVKLAAGIRSIESPMHTQKLEDTCREGCSKEYGWVDLCVRGG